MKVSLSHHLDDLDLPRIVETLTGVNPDLALDSLFQQAGIRSESQELLKEVLWLSHGDALRAAFAAGLACGLDPERLLLARLSAAADRLDALADRLEGAS